MYTQPVPDSLDANYYKVLEQNNALRTAVNSTVFDFEAQDIADRINVLTMRQKGMVAEAEALEQTRLARVQQHQQEQFQKETIARLNAMQQQIDSEVRRLKQQVAAAESAARSAQHLSGAIPIRQNCEKMKKLLQRSNFLKDPSKIFSHSRTR